MTASIQGVSGRRGRALLGCTVAALTFLVVRTAWLSDDAFISLRTAANWLHGYGLTWNPDERVQSFTHPLWLFALTGAHALTGEPFYSTLYLSCAVSCAAIALLAFTPSGGSTEKAVTLFALAFSQAFVDFSSSGLENPLTHLLLAAFASAYLTRPPSPARSTWLAATAGLCALNRLDSALLLAPALVAGVARERSARAVARLGWAVAPVALWELFSLIYYGFPFPNTAYAKLAQGGDVTGQRLQEGFLYIGESVAHDPLTLGAIAGCVALAFYRRDARRAWLLAGAVLYIFYVVSIGGDFMRGRFFSAPFFLAMFCLGTSDWLRAPMLRAGAAVAALTLALSAAEPPPFTGADYGKGRSQPSAQPRVHDERAMFFGVSSLRNARTMNPARPDHPWARGGRNAKAAAERDRNARVRLVDAIGYSGYYAGPGVHIFDRWALADALLARLPPAVGSFGHYPRVIPRGYLETLRTHENHIADPKLAAYYSQLALVVRGPLWSASRWHAIWNLNTGRAASLLDDYAYFRGLTFAAHVRLRNPKRYPYATTYVWSEGKTSSYFLDLAASAGKPCEFDWEISPHGARLSQPPLPPVTSLSGLPERGNFTISVALADAPIGPVREIYELRYAYSIVGGQLIMQRYGWPAFNRDMPNGPWHSSEIDSVLEVEPSR